MSSFTTFPGGTKISSPKEKVTMGEEKEYWHPGAEKIEVKRWEREEWWCCAFLYLASGATSDNKTL